MIYMSETFIGTKKYMLSTPNKVWKYMGSTDNLK